MKMKMKIIIIKKWNDNVDNMKKIIWNNNNNNDNDNDNKENNVKTKIMKNNEIIIMK